ncbi:MAG: LCP family protein [Oscillospiraceae bacterium]|nr:LCP family protein [Oscillospiraceae bacterium]
MKRKHPEFHSPRIPGLLRLFLGLVLVLIPALTIPSPFSSKQVLPAAAEVPLPGSSQSVFSPIPLNASSLPRIGGSGSGIINILLVGQDRREGEAFARSDSMILCTFHKESKKLILTSFLRDLYVEIPGFRPNRINAAYAHGGISLLRSTLEHNFGLCIDGSVEVDFSQFAGIIDLLGGVEVELRRDEAQAVNTETGSRLTAGRHRLNGMEALAYSRIRNLDSDGDFSRTNRQRKVMNALLESYRNIELNDLVPLLGKILPMITTDMNNGKLMLCALEILPHLSQAEVVSQHIPAPGSYTDRLIDGMYVLCADMHSARRLLRETLLGTQ